MQQHWNKAYNSTEVKELGWFQTEATPSLNLIRKCDLKVDDLILDIGVGASTLIDSLITDGYTNIAAVDISDIALMKLDKRLKSKGLSENVRLFQDDITDPSKINSHENVALWHDRAMLHFLVDEDHQEKYLKTLRSVVKVNGFVIIGAFNLSGAKKCSGLDIKNYDQNMLSSFLGNDFDLVDYFDDDYIQPSGNVRPYVFTLFKRIK
ncbi:MAG: class I SAM-dependent methyltransferase [Candidatus Kariarchaeaceae archaeon]